MNETNRIKSAAREVFASRVRAARKNRGWTQQELADRLKEIGYPSLSRATIAKIEDVKSTRSNASIEDVLAIAAALDCSPLHLIVPLSDDALISVTAGLPDVPALIARQWLRGGASLRQLLGLPTTIDDLRAFLSQRPEGEIRQIAAAMGLNADQTVDAIDGIRTGVIPWPTGRPTLDRAALAQRVEELEKELRAATSSLKAHDEREKNA